MPAGFNKGQVEYIKTIANVNAHKSYKPISFPTTNPTAATNHLTGTQNNYTKWRMWCLGRAPSVRVTQSGAANALAVLADPAINALDAFNIPMTSNSDAGVSTNQRVGPEGFLESTHLRLRFTLPHNGDGDFAADHGEYRLIVFRARERQHPELEKVHDQNNPFYNLFRGIRNYNIGFDGFEGKEAINGDVQYFDEAGANNYDALWVTDTGCMTLPVNKEAWVVMKDHRFFLGREYGGKNIYETTLHWDWNDPIATTTDYVDDTDNDKNYSWYILIMGNNNNVSSTNVANLQCKITGTTYMTSG